MNDFSISLTENDRVILDSYTHFAEGLSNYLGSCYEIVVHSLENLDISAIKVFNGFHTNRTEGAPITDLALQMLSRIQAEPKTNFISYFTTNQNGDPLRSTTIAIYGTNNRIIGLMCINFYLNSLLNEVIRPFFQLNAPGTPDPVLTENFAGNIDELLSKALTEATQTVQNNSQISASMRNREIISLLNQQGIFTLKDSVIKVAQLMGISKNTVYLHLRNLSAKKVESDAIMAGNE